MKRWRHPQLVLVVMVRVAPLVAAGAVITIMICLCAAAVRMAPARHLYSLTSDYLIARKPGLVRSVDSLQKASSPDAALAIRWLGLEPGTNTNSADRILRDGAFEPHRRALAALRSRPETDFVSVYSVGWPCRALWCARTREAGWTSAHIRIRTSPPQSFWCEGILPLGIYPLGLAINSVLFGMGLGMLWTTSQWGRRHLRVRRGRCPKCNYPLAGLAAAAPCPECGAARMERRRARCPTPTAPLGLRSCAYQLPELPFGCPECGRSWDQQSFARARQRLVFKRAAALGTFALISGLAVHLWLAPQHWLSIAPGWVLNAAADEQAMLSLLQRNPSDALIVRVLEQRHRRRTLPESTYQQAVEVMLDRYCEAVTAFSHDLPFAAVQLPALPQSDRVAVHLLVQTNSGAMVDHTWRARGSYASGAWSDAAVAVPLEDASEAPEIRLVLLANVFALGKTLRAERVIPLDVRNTGVRTREIIAPEIEPRFREVITMQLWRHGISRDDRPQLLLWGNLEEVLAALDATLALEIQILDGEGRFVARAHAWWKRDGIPKWAETLVLEVLDERAFYSPAAPQWIAMIRGSPQVAARDPALAAWWRGSFELRIPVGDKLEAIGIR